VASRVLAGVVVGAKVSIGVLDNTGVLAGICPAVQDARDNTISMEKQKTFFMFLSGSEVAAQLGV
jgi:hypothetical protein